MILYTTVVRNGGEIMQEYTLKNGEILIIREAVKQDAQAVIDYVKQIAGESDFLTFGEGEFNVPVEAEEEILEASQRADNQLYLLAEMNGEIVGSLNFMGGKRPRTKHIGEFGVSVLKEYWNQGIARKLLEYLITWVKESKVVRKINLKVRADHQRGIHLYESIGFVREGRITRAMYINGLFYDNFEMGMEID